MEDKPSVKSDGAEQYSRSFVFLMTLGVNLGALCFGYNMVIVSGAMLYAEPYFDLETTWQSLIVGAAVISATVSSMMAGPLTDKLGRRRALLLTAVLHVVGPVLAAAAPNKEVLLVGRLITGLTFHPPILSRYRRQPSTMSYQWQVDLRSHTRGGNAQLLSFFGPFQKCTFFSDMVLYAGRALSCPFTALYIAEMSPASIRGRLLSLVQLQVNLGMLLSAVMAGAFSYLSSNQWRYMFGFAALPAVIYGIAVFVLPETPWWLIARGRDQEATQVLQRIYGGEGVSQKLKDIQESVSSDVPTDGCSTLPRLVKTPHVLKALAVGSCLAFFFVWSGINAILFFCGTIMKIVGFPLEHAIWIQGLAALAMVISSLPGVLAVEKYGRRPLVLISIGGCALWLVMVAVGFHLTTADVPNVQPFTLTNGSLSVNTSSCHTFTECEACVQDESCGLCYKDKSGFCLPALNEYHSTLGPCIKGDQRDEAFKFALDYCPSLYAWIVVAGIFLYCIFFSPGMAALTFAINAEIYPMWARSTCTSVVVSQFWLFNVIMTFSFLSIIETFNTYGTFWFFAAMATLGFVLLAIFLPETKNRSLEEVEELFMTSQQLQRHRQQRESSQTDATPKEQAKKMPPICEDTTRI